MKKVLFIVALLAVALAATPASAFTTDANALPSGAQRNPKSSPPLRAVSVFRPNSEGQASGAISSLAANG